MGNISQKLRMKREAYFDLLISTSSNLFLGLELSSVKQGVIYIWVSFISVISKEG